LKTAERLRQAGDQTGAVVWERLAAEIDRTDPKLAKPPKTTLPS
jgi:hypothetical protein